MDVGGSQGRVGGLILPKKFLKGDHPRFCKPHRNSHLCKTRTLVLILSEKPLTSHSQGRTADLHMEYSFSIMLHILVQLHNRRSLAASPARIIGSLNLSVSDATQGGDKRQVGLLPYPPVVRVLGKVVS